MKYFVNKITRIQEGASWEDIEDGLGYETVFVVRDETGETIWETTNYENVRPYEESMLQDLALEQKEQM